MLINLSITECDINDSLDIVRVECDRLWRETVLNSTVAKAALCTSSPSVKSSSRSDHGTADKY